MIYMVKCVKCGSELLGPAKEWDMLSKHGRGPSLHIRLMDVLLSIRPEYTEKLFSGEKRYEFRKRKPKETIGKALVYESRRSRMIVGWFSVRTIHSGSPQDIWEKCKDHGGIEEENYVRYCNGNKIIHALEVDQIVRFNPPINPFNVIPDFKPPQNFSYVADDLIHKASIESQEATRCLNSD